MGSTYSHLSLGERRWIEEMLNARFSVTRIADELGRHRSTVHREIARNFHHTAFRDRFGNGYRGYHSVARDRSPAALSALSDKLNATPRRCLGYRTPTEVFQARLAQLMGAE
ncbi:MAG TPA: helix-turn-helix domain-containing protein [Azospirillaceae bacterium]|nr:helix-turn-helix domain-containing protein [Azospirillaceae bacterium]